MTRHEDSLGRVRIGIYNSTVDDDDDDVTMTEIHTNTDSVANEGSEGGKFWVYYPKLEEGSEATPWIDKEI